MDVMTTVVGAAAADQDRKGPGRPRSARADEAIIEAVLDLIAEGTTIEALSIEAVASRASVGKATIYRRWSSKDALIVDAVASLKGPIPEIVGESVRDDLVVLLGAVRRKQLGRAGRIMPCLVPEVRRNPELYKRYQSALEPRRELMRQVLRRGVQTGELRPDLDVDGTMLLLNGPVLMQSLLDWNPDIDIETLPERIVDLVLTGIRGPNG
jgi:AcrR family transcriptional regulator